MQNIFARTTHFNEIKYIKSSYGLMLHVALDNPVRGRGKESERGRK